MNIRLYEDERVSAGTRFNFNEKVEGNVSKYPAKSKKMRAVCALTTVYNTRAVGLRVDAA